MKSDATATTPLRLGTRRSKLAMAQSGLVAEEVRRVTGRPVELVEITTYGDISREHLAQIGGTGVFVNALRDSLASGEIDFAVHSLKDLVPVVNGRPRAAPGRPSGVPNVLGVRSEHASGVVVERECGQGSSWFRLISRAFCRPRAYT